MAGLVREECGGEANGGPGLEESGLFEPIGIGQGGMIGAGGGAALGLGGEGDCNEGVGGGLGGGSGREVGRGRRGGGRRG